jgi:peptide/nickel transport system permease protein
MTTANQERIAPAGEVTVQGSDQSVLNLKKMAWRRFKRHRLAVVSAVILLILILLAIFAPLISAHDPYTPNMYSIRKPPSSEHILGTDGSGRDVFARLLWGGRVSLSVGLVAVSIYITIGTILGGIAGYWGKTIDFIIMRVTDVIMCFPTLLIILAIVPLVGPSIFNIMVVIGFLGWTGIARLVRGEFLSLSERDYVLAARATGVPDRRIIFRHILPNVVGPLIVAATFGIAGAIIAEAGLSFLGLGVQAPQSSWGNMLNAATSLAALQWQPWMWVPPGVMIAITVLCINFIGDGLRDALDPRSLW